MRGQGPELPGRGCPVTFLTCAEDPGLEPVQRRSVRLAGCSERAGHLRPRPDALGQWCIARRGSPGASSAPGAPLARQLGGSHPVAAPPPGDICGVQALGVGVPHPVAGAAVLPTPPGC